MNKFIKKPVNLTPKKSSLMQTIEENKKENIDPLSENEQLKKKLEKTDLEIGEIKDDIKSREYVRDFIKSGIEPAQKQLKNADTEEKKQEIREKIQEIKERVAEQDYNIEIAKKKEYEAVRRRGKQKAPLKSEAFTRHTVIIRKEYLDFWKAMTRLNQKITLTDIIDGVFKKTIEEMDAEEYKEVMKEKNKKFKFFEKYGIGKENE